MSDKDNKKNKKSNSGSETSKGDSFEPATDLNRLRVRILIICSREKNFDSALTYLSRRGWNAQITSNVLDGFKQITSFEPSFVLLSVNVKTNTLQKLASVIYNTFKIPVLLIGEGTDTLTMKLMMEISANFKLQGQPSGPSIHRTIKNILADLSKSDSMVAKEMFKRAIKKSIRLGDNESGEWKKQKKVGYTFSSDSQDENETKKERYSFSEQDESGSGYNFENQIDGDSKVISSDQTDENGEGESNHVGETYFHAGDEKEFQILGKKKKKKELSISQSKEEEKEDPYQITEEESSGEEEYKLEFENKPLDRFDEIELSGDSNSMQDEENNPAAVAIVDLSKPKPIHFIVKIADKNIIILNQESKETPILENYLWTVQSKSKSFILLCQVQGNRSQAEQFLKGLEHDLKEQITFELSDAQVTSRLKIDREMDFDQKIEGEVFTYEVKGENLLTRLKYLNVKGRTPGLRKSGYSDRLKVSGDDLVVGMNSGADIYIYLPNNKKFIRYIDENTIVQEKQKSVISDSEAFIIFSSESQYKATFVRNKAIEKVFKQETKDQPKKKKPA